MIDRERGWLARTTRYALRFRYVVVAFWLAVLLAGAVASLHLRPLLANGFGVPHTDSQIAGPDRFLVIYEGEWDQHAVWCCVLENAGYEVEPIGRVREHRTAS